MKAISSPLAALLCCILSAPAPLTSAQQAPGAQEKVGPRSTYQSTQLSGDERILHALNRFTFGPRPGDLEAVRAWDLNKWFDQQLHPASIEETSLNARLAQFPAMQWSTADLLYRLPSNGEIRQAINGKAAIPQNGTLRAIYENQMYRIQAKKDEKAQKSASSPAPASVSAPMQTSPGANMQLASDGSMVKVDAAGNVAGMAENSMGANTSPAAMSATSQPNMNAAQSADAQPAFDDASIRQILALPPQQRVAQLAAMQPADFESFIKSLRPPQRVALNADLTPELKLTVGALENPERLVAEELIAVAAHPRHLLQRTA